MRAHALSVNGPRLAQPQQVEYSASVRPQFAACLSSSDALRLGQPRSGVNGSLVVSMQSLHHIAWFPE
jgi:hypothetical protein